MGKDRAPTDGFLELLSERMRRFRDVNSATASPGFLEHETVRRYADSLADMSAADRSFRLATLEGFAQFVDQTPDEMVELIFDPHTRKYRKRGFYSDKAKEFGAALDGPSHLQLARSNVVRSFFIANGYRLPPERPSWM